MRLALPIAAAALLVPGVGAAADDDRAGPPRAQSLIDQGATLVAEGELIESVTCPRWTMRVVGWRVPESCIGKLKYGSFKRLKSNDDEFVCVSFRDWACYPSRTQN
jgi:hypothetical protein